MTDPEDDGSRPRRLRVRDMLAVAALAAWAALVLGTFHTPPPAPPAVPYAAAGR